MAAKKKSASAKPAKAPKQTTQQAGPAKKAIVQRTFKAKKLSAIDAAAKVLGEKGEPMTCPEMIEAMAAKGYWSSPGGKTPAATLYAAILREISLRAKEARFVKTERGKFRLKS